MTDLHPARRLWTYLEPIHSVTYFAPECTASMADLGLKGFRMGYFASRGAPFGAVGPAIIEATVCLACGTMPVSNNTTWSLARR